jgi:formylglycine-generating enzyme required for sulfatase activity
MTMTDDEAADRLARFFFELTIKIIFGVFIIAFWLLKKLYAHDPKLFWIMIGVAGIVASVYSGVYTSSQTRREQTLVRPTPPLQVSQLVAPSNTPTTVPTPSPTTQLTNTPVLLIPTVQPATSGVGSARVWEKDGMVMVYVSASEFLMGSADSDREAISDEKPQHTVYLDAFWIDKTEVTNAQYKKCVQAGACRPPSRAESSTRKNYYGNSQYDNYPVIWVSWNDAKTYCEWAGRRLPTEAEWEKAARGIDGRIYPWGNGTPNSNLLNFNMQVGDTTEVGTYPSGASPYDVLDMAGNVWELVADWYNSNYYASSPFRNPVGPSSGQYRVVRGGSWGDAAKVVRVALRLWPVPTFRDDVVGFRCATAPK